MSISAFTQHLRQVFSHTNDDLVLIQQIAQGERKAFDQLMLKYVDQAYSVAYRMTQHSEQAEDIVQDVFIKVWQNALQWDASKAKFSTWLHRMIINRCIDVSRARSHHYLEACEDIQQFANNDQSDVLTEQSEKQAYLEQALQQLNEQQYTAMVLTYSSGLSNKEAAAVMDIKLKTFESLLVRTRQQLRQYLSQFYSEDL